MLAENSVSFPAPDTMSTAEGDAGFGDLIADAYRYAALRTSAGSQAPATIAVVSQSVIRAALPAGTLTVEDAFRVLPGSGEEAGQGDPLIVMYLTGRELENVAEIDASFGSSDVAAALHFSGIVHLQPRPHPHGLRDRSETGPRRRPDRLDPTATPSTAWSPTALPSRPSSPPGAAPTAFEISSPRTAGGNEITDWDSAILRDETGAPVMAWQGLALYLASFAPDAEHIGAVPAAYAQSDGRKTVVHRQQRGRHSGKPRHDHRRGLGLHRRDPGGGSAADPAGPSAAGAGPKGRTAWTRCEPHKNKTAEKAARQRLALPGGLPFFPRRRDFFPQKQEGADGKTAVCAPVFRFHSTASRRDLV